MSRNFEVLRQLGKEQQIFDTRAELPASVALDVESPSFRIELEEKQNDGGEQKEPAFPPPTIDLQMSPLVREQLAKMMRRLFLLEGGPRVVVFSGLERGAGCSWIAARAASFLAAQISGSVCLVDANLRYPALHDIFGINNHHGLSDAIGSSAPIREFVRPLAPKNLWLLSCGSSDKNGNSLLASEGLHKRLLQLRSAFDYIVIDTPPANECSDVLTVASGADGFVLILRANSSRRDTAQKFLIDLKAANVRLLGTILNRRMFPVPEAVYKRL